jgi:uncharacterized SAM-binding protein YcdF (DUF218 family)
MFFILASTLGVIIIPSRALTLMALLGGLLLLTRFRNAGRRILIGCLIVLVVVGAWPVGNALMLTLENRFPPWSGIEPPDGIVILGGPVSIEGSMAHGHPAIGEGAERLTEIPALAKRFPNARIVFTGGNPTVAGGPPEAKFVVPLLVSFGIPRERIEVEDRSRNTAENAAFTAALVKPKPGERWLLVTSAWHMPRAVGAFRKAGFPVEPYPVDYVVVRPLGWRWLVPSLSFPRGWATLDIAAKEWIGLLAYRLAGNSSELFPGPGTGGPSR